MELGHIGMEVVTRDFSDDEHGHEPPQKLNDDGNSGAFVRII